MYIYEIYVNLIWCMYLFLLNALPKSESVTESNNPKEILYLLSMSIVQVYIDTLLWL